MKIETQTKINQRKNLQKTLTNSRGRAPALAGLVSGARSHDECALPNDGAGGGVSRGSRALPRLALPSRSVRERMPRHFCPAAPYANLPSRDGGAHDVAGSDSAWVVFLALPSLTLGTRSQSIANCHEISDLIRAYPDPEASPDSLRRGRCHRRYVRESWEGLEPWVASMAAARRRRVVDDASALTRWTWPHPTQPTGTSSREGRERGGVPSEPLRSLGPRPWSKRSTCTPAASSSSCVAQTFPESPDCWSGD